MKKFTCKVLEIVKYWNKIMLISFSKSQFALTITKNTKISHAKVGITKILLILLKKRWLLWSCSTKKLIFTNLVDLQFVIMKYLFLVFQWLSIVIQVIDSDTINLRDKMALTLQSMYLIHSMTSCFITQTLILLLLWVANNWLQKCISDSRLIKYPTQEMSIPWWTSSDH